MKKQNPTDLQTQHESTDMLANCAWLLSLSALWPSCIHTDDEQSAAVKIIKKRLYASDNQLQTYLEICQRVLLTRQRMIADRGYGISNLPTRFFNSTEKGFAASEPWYQELLSQRKRSRIYQLELKALAEAILEFAEESTPENFEYWKNWFIINNALDCWMLFSQFTCYYLITKL